MMSRRVAARPTTWKECHRPADWKPLRRLADPMRTRPMTATPADPRSEHHLARRMTGRPAGPKTESHLARPMTATLADPKTERHLARRTRGCRPIGAVRCRGSRRRTPAMGCHRSGCSLDWLCPSDGLDGLEVLPPDDPLCCCSCSGNGLSWVCPWLPCSPDCEGCDEPGLPPDELGDEGEDDGDEGEDDGEDDGDEDGDGGAQAYPTSGSPSCSRSRPPGWPENRVSRILSGSSSHRPRAYHPGGRTPGPNVPAHCLEPAVGFRVQCWPVEPAAAGALTAVSGTTARSFPNRNERSCSDS